MIDRVSATETTVTLIDELVGIHGPVVFHQSGGCCDGSAPMCFPRGEFRVGSRDVFLGTIHNQPFFIAEDQFTYWEHTQLIIDVVPGRGGMFSIEGPTGQRFLTRSRVFSDEESAVLQNNPPARASEIDDIEGLKKTS
ncbi:MAG: DUF779 domain-containing protein [Candidatus Puniceispirillum sp.]|jgi:uncharacterized protein|nr:DUF779 domain-containing protein [Candidatus Puniceispirillum sp.]